ncbi:MAG: hypothetical protein SGI88_08365 [Candidatus Hydrogenedentes bacterium]|nr:hypothetical protein [Candidatus Hydrogenedentota bacterium]
MNELAQSPKLRKPVPGWEWGLSFFLTSVLLTGLFVFTVQFFGLSTSAHSRFIAIWIVTLGMLSYGIAKVRRFRKSVIMASLIGVVVATYQSTGFVAKLGEAEATSFAAVLIDEMQAYHSQYGHYPSRDALGFDGETCARIMNKWDALRSEMFVSRFNSCGHAVAGGRVVSIKGVDNSGLITVRISAASLAPGRRLSWDWESEEWVLDR